MITLVVNGDSKECPVTWAETSTDIFQNIFSTKLENQVEVFSILTGTNYTSVLEDDDEDLDTTLYQVTAFVFNEPQDFRERPVPAAVKLAGKTVMIPRNLSALTVGQNLHIRQAMATAPNLESLISLACAIYLQPLVDGGKFDYARAKELEQEILKLPIYTTFPIGFFFLKKLNNSGRRGVLASLRSSLRRMRNGLRSMRWPKRIGLNHSTI